MIISKPKSGQRLDQLLVQQFPQYSRAQWQHWIKEQAVTVNDQAVTKHYMVQAHDTIDIADTVFAEQRPALQLVANPTVPFTVLAETTDYIVINKPAGVVIHPAAGHQTHDTLCDGLIACWPEIQQVGDDPLRPGIVQRLDRAVSGVMVVARTPAMWAALKQQFHDHTVEKRYVALVHGAMTRDHDTINFSIERSSRDGRKMAAKPTGQGKTAITEYDVLQRWQDYTLVELRLHTGRTHQLRVHLNAIGHPIVGDTVYRPKRLISRLQPGRILLHAHSLSFKDLANNNVTFTADLPEDFVLP